MKFQDLFGAPPVDVVAENQVLSPDDGADLHVQLETAIKRFSAVRQTLSAVNRLRRSERKSGHASKVMGMLNKARAEIKRIERLMAASDD